MAELFHASYLKSGFQAHINRQSFTSAKDVEALYKSLIDGCNGDDDKIRELDFTVVYGEQVTLEPVKVTTEWRIRFAGEEPL